MALSLLLIKKPLVSNRTINKSERLRVDANDGSKLEEDFRYFTRRAETDRQAETQLWDAPYDPRNLLPGELPGYTGWARPEQTLAGYFDVNWKSHSAPTSSRYDSIATGGERYQVLFACNSDKAHEGYEHDDLPYECPQGGGSLFYVRAYGPSVITGSVTDYRNSSYLVEVQFIDPGEYTLEVVVAFSAPLDFEELPINRNRTAILMNEVEEEMEPGFEGYMVAGFPQSILIRPNENSAPSSDKPLCTMEQLTETSPGTSLNKGHWKVTDIVARAEHFPISNDELLVSLDGYRMGVNSVGVRMGYVYEGCEPLHVKDIVQGEHILTKCLAKLGMATNLTGVETQESVEENVTSSVDDAFDEGLHIIFVGDSVMKLEWSFFNRLLRGSARQLVKSTFIETNGGINKTLRNITDTLEQIRVRENGKNIKRAIQFNSGLHDIDVLCSSKRAKTRDTMSWRGDESCGDAYRRQLDQLVSVIDAFPADVKLFRSSTAGWHKYGNYGFAWPASEMQFMSRSSHVCQHFNEIAFEVIQSRSNAILIADGYWTTLPRPDHTQVSNAQMTGKHLVHPGYEVLGLFARRWLHIAVLGLCGTK